MNRCIGVAAIAGLALLAPPANAATLFSISGVVGDSNLPCSPIVGFCYFIHTFSFPLDPNIQGLVEYSGPAITYSEDVFITNSSYDQWICEIPGGCQGRDLRHFGGDNGPADYNADAPIGATSFSDAFDTTRIYTTAVEQSFSGPVVVSTGPSTDVPSLPPLPEGYFFDVHYVQVTGFSLDQRVSPDDIGQAFSLTVSTVPEPATWAMMLAGFGAVGFAVRRRTKRLLPQRACLTVRRRYSRFQ
jgi:hypothetical protein